MFNSLIQICFNSTLILRHPSPHEEQKVIPDAEHDPDTQDVLSVVVACQAGKHCQNHADAAGEEQTSAMGFHLVFCARVISYIT